MKLDFKLNDKPKNYLNSNKSRVVNISKFTAKIQTSGKKVTDYATKMLIQEKKRINNKNIIYYVFGSTIFVIFIIFVVPIIYYNLTYKPPIKSPSISQKTTAESRIISQIESKKSVDSDSKKPEVSTATIVKSREEMIGIFKQNLNDNTPDNLEKYIEKDAKVYLWSASCCLDKDTKSNFLVGVLKAAILQKTTWNFDQVQPDIESVKAIDPQFNDNYYALSSDKILVGIKLSSNNKISVLNIAKDVQVVKESIIKKTEADFLRAYNAAQ
jgi:hypothetical protein